ncbi:Bax inhibitor-1/YccA family protein [Draconibacterium halophilum]|uniref:Bax inhibitor-1/YccA family protein n=1 Tax=Draconibacterium halophilum TaxID=2706887 RepID=A0A6C0RAF5_9BACT|nr:Bax inhibitor-1/YccA family protein [Draconibacterium halophilum]QIA06986.1 Bax inhibitor-1/YccA family protein [Draconibacterium halophilum]
MMNLSKSSNPVLKEKAFSRNYTAQSDVMTVHGTINKTALMLLLVIAGAVFTWNKFFDAGATTLEGGLAAVGPWLAIGGIGGFITVLVTVFRPQSSGISAPIYAVFQGLFLGGISALFEAQYSNIVMRAVMLTLAVFMMMLFLYRSGIIKVTKRFMMGVMAATAGIALVYFVSFIAGMFGAQMSFLHGNSNLSIGISLVVVAVAALNLVLDFSFIERASESGAPKYMEWYGAFGLMVTLIWLYLEILRLLSKLASRN